MKKFNLVTKDHSFPLKAKEVPILIYPHPVLKTVASPVQNFDRALKELCQNMLKTMYHAPGIGLAAPQIGISQRIFVCDVNYNRIRLDGSDEEDEEFAENNPDVEIAEVQKTYELKNLNPKIFINPRVVVREGETVYEEGCLSLPGVFDKVTRSKKIELQYEDTEGKTHYENADDLYSICCQHEIDHLDGILFIERLSQLKFEFYKKKFMKNSAKNSAKNSKHKK